jgi:hypothetical protein
MATYFSSLIRAARELFAQLMRQCRHRRESWPQRGFRTCLDCGHRRQYTLLDHVRDWRRL